MAENKIYTYNNMTSKKLTLKQIYKAFNLRYDVREARRFLEMTKSTPKTEVNNVLRNYYHSIEEETHQPIYTYTLTGTSQMGKGKLENILKKGGTLHHHP